MTGRPGPCRTQPPCPVGLVPFHWDPMTAPKSSQRACGAPDASSLQAWSPPIPFDFEQAEQAAENRIFKIFPCGATGFGPRGPQKRLEALGKVCSGRGPRLCIKFLARRAKHLMHSMYSFYRKKTLICSYLLAESIFFRSVKKFRKVFHSLFQRAYTDLPTPTEQKVDFWIF